MTELEQIAASVAKALGLGEPYDILLDGKILLGRGWTYGNNELYENGSNLFDPYWQVRCRDFLHDIGHIYSTANDSIFISLGDNRTVRFKCPAGEFYARAIHALSGKD